MKIFITGASGFIGSHLYPALNSVHHVHCMTSDLLDFESVTSELLAFAPDVIVHLAARTEVEKSFYEQIPFSQVNYVGTVNLIESAVLLSKKSYFVFASTMEVYGWQPISDLIEQGLVNDRLPAFDESTVPNPNAPYAVAKFGCEKYIEYAGRAHGLDYAILRQTNSYGRKDNDFFVTEQIICQMIANANECNLGIGTAYRNFIYIDDLIAAWITVIENKELCKNHIFTVGPDHPIQIKQHAQNIADILNWNGIINWKTKPRRHGEIYLLNSTHKKLTSLTGWTPSVNYNDGISKTIDTWKKIKYNM